MYDHDGRKDTCLTLASCPRWLPASRVDRRRSYARTDGQFVVRVSEKGRLKDGNVGRRSTGELSERRRGHLCFAHILCRFCCCSASRTQMCEKIPVRENQPPNQYTHVFLEDIAGLALVWIVLCHITLSDLNDDRSSRYYM